MVDRMFGTVPPAAVAAALQAEVSGRTEQFADVRGDDGHRLQVHNGYHAARPEVTGPVRSRCGGRG
jgi:hypothetical protein